MDWMCAATCALQDELGLISEASLTVFARDAVYHRRGAGYTIVFNHSCPTAPHSQLSGPEDFVHIEPVGYILESQLSCSFELVPYLVDGFLVRGG